LVNKLTNGVGRIPLFAFPTPALSGSGYVSIISALNLLGTPLHKYRVQMYDWNLTIKNTLWKKRFLSAKIKTRNPTDTRLRCLVTTSSIQ